MDKCLKNYFKFYNDSCWIDSLFVALFHNSSSIIKNFVTNLKLNNININTSEEKGEKIINEIKTIYKYLNTDENHLYDTSHLYLETDKEHKTNNNIRKLLNDHLNLNVDVDNIGNYDDFEKDNNSMDLLKYLFFYIFDTNSSNNITNYSWNYNDFKINKYNSLRNEYTNEYNIQPEYKNINFIKFIHNMNECSNLKNYKFEELNKLDKLSLHSIIAHDGDHYICYYKCSNKWYKYDDLGLEEYRVDGRIAFRTKLIGEFEHVMKDYHKIIETKFNKLNKNRKLEFILLYLKTNKIQKLKELVDNHFEKLKNLL